MPLQISYQSENIKKRIKRQVRQLLVHKQLPLAAAHTQLHIVGMMNIQQLAHYDGLEIKTSSPEGERVLISDGEEVVAFIDMYYRGQRLFTGHVMTGAPVDEFVNALNALSDEYSKTRPVYYANCVEFLFAAHPYLAVFNDEKISIYGFEKGMLHKVPIPKLRTTLRGIKDSIEVSPNT